jgi:hypothetical protein
MSYDEMNEVSEEEFETAAELVKNMNEEEFRSFFSELFDQLDGYDRGTDALLLQFALNREEGIEKWRMQHLDLTREGDLWDKQKSVRDFEEDVGLNALGANTVTITTIQEETPAQSEFRAGLYAAFRQAAKTSEPNLIITNPSVQIRLASTEDGFSVSFESDPV